ncbi:choloylglycine hydrolase [Photobacterium jeanii]|uniref:Choloylglycine hydrolase n=1 Tax=Photobacterium jeanii TaxID=858640 RepID=A0A178K308_9GAMM|nr:linear amide C-N hydrolase [Photobacterium jeanii]OAN11335.1 choloylglycine hydrolase [Photobacterium jeanii]PST90856.1 linear amide C-N hydrolase [Photobacterium jeanii]
MKNLLKKTAIALTVAASFASTANACSRLLWETDDHGVFVSRTMDWMEANQPTVEVRPAGQTYKGYTTDNALEWTSKYASIGMTIYGVGIIDGFNEAGFSANALFLDEETSGDIDGEKAQIINAAFTAYLIDSFATVSEALENIHTIEIQQFEHNGIAMKGHYSIQDASGDSAVLEFVEDKWNIYHGKQYDVMTNSPEFAEHLKNWEKAKPKADDVIDGNFTVPGNIMSSQRFVWNKYMKSQLKEPSSYVNGIAKLDSATYKIPMDAANRPDANGVMRGYATLYSVGYNLDEKVLQVRYQYDDSYTHYFVDFNKVNNGKTYSLQADLSDLFGDVTGRLKVDDGVMSQYKTQ